MIFWTSNKSFKYIYSYLLSRILKDDPNHSRLSLKDSLRDFYISYLLFLRSITQLIEILFYFPFRLLFVDL